MSKFAYLDKEKTKIVKADECVGSDRDKTYYCPTPGCFCELKICALNSKTYKPYFKRAHTKTCHTDYCIKTELFSSTTEYDESRFDFEKIVKNAMGDTKKKETSNSNADKRSDKTSTTYIKTFSKAYYLARALSIDAKYNEYKISDIIIDDRTAYIYTKYANGFKMIRCYFHRYDKDKNKIYLICNDINIICNFQSEQVFKEVIKKLFCAEKFKEKSSKRPIAICGIVESSVKQGKMLINIDINNDKQIIFPYK